MSIPSFSSYTPPGVFVAPTNTPIVTVSGVNPQILALAGPALGYRTATQSFLIYAATGAVLTFTGVFTTAQAGPPAIAAPVVTITGTSTALIAGTDYTLTVTPDPSGNSALAVTSVTRVNTSPSLTSDGIQVTITYSYADVTYYQPQLFSSLAAVINAYGQPLVSSAPTVPNTSQVANPLSYGAQIAFAAGANQLYCVATNPADGTLEQQLIAAYSKLASNPAVTIMAPVYPDYLSPLVSPSTSTAYAALLAQDLDAACRSAASAGFPRIGFFGLPIDYSETSTPASAFAQAINDKRLVIAYPEIIQSYNSQTRQTFQASGCYLAVALAAMLSALPVNTGLTGQAVGGFTLTANEIQAMTPAFMNTLGAAGVTVVYKNRQGALQVRQGLTTQMSAINTREISLVRQSDSLLLLLQSGLESSGLIGSPITATMVATVQGAITSILQQAVNSSVIIAWTNLSVIQQAYPGGDPTIIAASFSYAPALPLNYITVTYSIDLSNGLVATQAAQNASAPNSASA